MLRNPCLSLTPVHSVEISVEIPIFNSLDDSKTGRMIHEQAGEVINIICEDSHWLILILLQFLDTLDRSVLVFFIIRHDFGGHGGEPNFDCNIAGKEEALDCEHDPPEDGVVPIHINDQVGLNFGEEKHDVAQVFVAGSEEINSKGGTFSEELDDACDEPQEGLDGHDGQDHYSDDEMPLLEIVVLDLGDSVEGEDRNG